MLHENPLMADIDVNHWRNLQSLVLESAKARRRIIVIHEAGEIQKFIHSQKVPIVRPVSRITDPHADAEAIFAANPGLADFVAVFERRAFDAYFAEFQGTWRADEDLDTFVRRTYALLDSYPDGMVTYPGPARDTLGLQWRLGTTYDAVAAWVGTMVDPESSVVLGIFEGTALWATLVLHFDADHRADVVSTVDVSRLHPAGDWKRDAAEVVSWVDETYGKVSVGLFTDVPGARSFLAAGDKAAAVASIAGRGALHVERAPAGIMGLLARA
jgi:hypothetical protein